MEADGKSSPSEELNLWTESGSPPNSLTVRCSKGNLVAKLSDASNAGLQTVTVSAPAATENGSEIAEVCITGTCGPDNAPFEVIVPVAVYYFPMVDTVRQSTVSRNFAPVTDSTEVSRFPGGR